MSKSCIYKSYWIGHFVIKHLYLFVRNENKTSIVIREAVKKMPKIDTLDALEEHKEHEDDYQTNSNW